MKDRALLLIGHGSSFGSGAAEPVYEHAARVRARGMFDEVHVAFWKQEPHVNTALTRIGSRVIDVVPLFLADGFFTRQVLPAALGLRGRVTHVGGQTVHYRQPVGMHPDMAHLTLHRALEATPLSPDTLRQAALLVVGHGTPRDPASSAAVRDVCARLRRFRIYHHVAAAYLDEPPFIPAALAQLAHAHVTVVPFLLSDGWHTRTSIPDQLALTGKRADAAGRTLWYARAVGTMPQLASIAIDCALGTQLGAADEPNFDVNC